MIDFDRRVAVLLVFVLHFIGDDATASHILTTLREAMAPGSYLVLSHGTAEGVPPSSLSNSSACTSAAPVPGRPARATRWNSSSAVWTSSNRASSSRRSDLRRAPTIGTPTIELSSSYAGVGRKP
ncbi:MAG: SAM-dependent methyltransferase [Chloroflexota bacterium]